MTFGRCRVYLVSTIMVVMNVMEEGCFGMKKYLRKRIHSVGREASGFTLVELLVVVGIIVALAGVIIPNVTQYINKGDDGARAAELVEVQQAIDTYIADKYLVVLPGVAGADAHDGPLATSTNDFSTGGILDLESPGTAGASFMRGPTTEYFYCWDITGKVLLQDAASTLDCTR